MGFVTNHPMSLGNMINFPEFFFLKPEFISKIKKCSRDFKNTPKAERCHIRPKDLIYDYTEVVSVGSSTAKFSKLSVL